MNRTVALVGALALSFVTAACQSQPLPVDRLGAEPGPVVVVPPPTSASPPQSPPATASPSLSPSHRPAPPRYDVKAVQRALTDLRYYIGPIDGEPGPAFRSAVMAFQKVNGLHADGVVGKRTAAALRRPATPVLRGGSGSGTRVEVDLTKQVLYLVEDGELTRILPVSSGSGERYRTASGGTATALTPVGWFTVERRIVGVRQAALGTLYDPQYFYRGWAIHGSNSVPAYPASHGCVRVTRADATWLLGQISVGTQVYLYGGRHTFPAGSSAAGTADPGGDVDPSASPSATANPGTTATRGPSPEPSAKPSRTPSPTPSPTGSGAPKP